MPTTLADLTMPYKLLTNPEANGTYEGQINDGNREETLSFMVAFADREAFISQAIGKREQYGDYTTGQIIANEPLQHPWNQYLFASAISWRSMGMDSTQSLAAPWTNVVCDVTFRALNWTHDDPSQPYLSYRIRGSTSAITIPGWQNSFTPSGEKIEGDVTRLVGQKSIEVTRYNIPDLARFETVCDSVINYVNATTLTIKGRAYAAGTIQFVTYSADEENQGLGQTKATASLQFLYRAIGWNNGITSTGLVQAFTYAPYTTGNLAVLLS